MAESRVDLGAGSPDAGEVGYYPEGPPKKLSAAEEKIARDIADLGPYLEGNYLAQLGLEVVPPERIVELKKRYNVAGFYSPQDISSTGRDSYKRAAVLEMLGQGRDARKLYGDPGVRKDVLAYSYPDVSERDLFVEPFDEKVGSRLSGSDFPIPKKEEYIDRDLTEEEARQEGLATLIHELTHAGDVALTRMQQVDDEPYRAGEDLGENYARLIDIMSRDRGLGSFQTEAGRQLEGRAVSQGLQGRYFGDPFVTRVRKSGFFNRRERLDPEDFEKAVLSVPAQDAARREVLRRMAERTPTGGYKDGGEVEPVGIEKSVTISKVVPYVDPRSAALGSRLLKQAGIPGDFSSLMQRADPKVMAQVNRIMARGPTNEISSPANGLGVFMQSVTKQG